MSSVTTPCVREGASRPRDLRGGRVCPLTVTPSPRRAAALPDRARRRRAPSRIMPHMKCPHAGRGGRAGASRPASAAEALRSLLVRLMAALPCLASSGALAQSPDASDWGYYGGDAFGQRFSSLGGINRGNVSRLKVVWTYRTGELGAAFTRAGKLTFEATPVLAFGLLSVETATNIVIAPDPESGHERWRVDPHIPRARGDPRLRRQERRAALVLRSAAGLAVTPGGRRLGPGAGGGHGRGQRLGRDDRRRGARTGAASHRLGEPRLLRRRASRQQPLRQLAARARCEERQAGLAPAAHPPRSLGLRPRGAAGARRRRGAGSPGPRGDPGDQDRHVVCVRAHRRTAARPDHRETGAREPRAGRAGVAHAALLLAPRAHSAAAGAAFGCLGADILGSRQVP